MGPVGSYLSGGLDSSSISVIANELLRQQGRAEPLEDAPPSYIPEWVATSPATSRKVWSTLACAPISSLLARPSLDYYRQQADRYQDFPGWPNGFPMIWPFRSRKGSTRLERW